MERWSAEGVELDVPTRSGERAWMWVAAGLAWAVLAVAGAALLQAAPTPQAAELTVEEATACLLADGASSGRRCNDVRGELERRVPDFEAFTALRSLRSAMEGEARPRPVELVVLGAPYLPAEERVAPEPEPPPPLPDPVAERDRAQRDWEWMQREPGVLAANAGVLEWEVGAENAWRARLAGEWSWWLAGFAGLGLIGAALAWRRPRSVRVRLGVDAVTVGGTRVPQAEVDTLQVSGDRLVITAGSRVVRTGRLADVDALRRAIAAWRSLEPPAVGGAPDPALGRLREPGVET